MNGLPGRRRVRALAGLLATMALPGTACAQTAPPLAQLLRDAAASPRTAVLDAEVDRAQGLAEQAQARPNPSIGIYGENFGGTAPYAGFGRTETTLQYNHPFELGGKRAARIDAARAGVAASQARGMEGRIAHAHELTRAYAAAEVADRRIALAEDEVEEATADLRVAHALVAAGKEARLRQLQAETELNTLQSDLATARAQRTAAFALLSALAGVATPYVALSGSLLDLPAVPSAGPPDPRASAAVRAAEAERAAAGLRVAVERKRAIPDLTAQVGIRRLEADRATALVAGLSLPLPVFDRNRGAIAAAEAEARAAEARAAIARLDAQAAASSAAALIDAADARAAAAARTMATAQEAYRLARIAYEAGKSPLIELLAARHGLGVARASVLDAAAARIDALAGLARLQGRTMAGEMLP